MSGGYHGYNDWLSSWLVLDGYDDWLSSISIFQPFSQCFMVGSPTTNQHPVDQVIEAVSERSART